MPVHLLRSVHRDTLDFSSAFCCCRTYANLGIILLLMGLVTYGPQLIEAVVRDVASVFKALGQAAASACRLSRKVARYFMGPPELERRLWLLTDKQLAFIAEARGLKVTRGKNALIKRLLLTAPQGVAVKGTIAAVHTAGVKLGIPRDDMISPRKWRFNPSKTSKHEWRRRLRLLEDPLTLALVHHILHPHTARTCTAAERGEDASMFAGPEVPTTAVPQSEVQESAAQRAAIPNVAVAA